LVLLVMLAGWGASAQEEDLGLEDEFALLEEEDVVFSAAKHKQKAGFSPSAVIVITRKEIEESGALTIVELLRQYPAVTAFEHDPMYPSAEIRGTFRVLLLVDGREVNLEFFVAPFFVALPAGMNSIERIEIVLGPNSALYGADAVSAAINVITRKPSGDFHVDVSAAGGAHGTTVLEGSVQGGIGPVSARVMFGIDNADSWMERAVPSKQVNRIKGIVRLELPGADLMVRAGLVAGAGQFFGVVGYFDFKEFMLPYAQVDLEISDLKVTAYWNGLRTMYDLEMGLVDPNLGELGTLPRFNTDGDTFQVGAQYDLEPFEGNLLICGLDARSVTFHDPKFVDSDIVEYRLGAFLHDEQWFGDRVVLTLGVRFDYTSVTGPAVSPRVAVVYNPAGEHFLRFSGGMAFRKPTLLESSVNVYVDEKPAFPEIAELFEVYGTSDSDVSNEKLVNVEVGYRGALLDNALRLRIDVYLGTSWDTIGFENYIHIEDTPLGPRIIPGESRLGYDNVGNDDWIIGVNAGVTWEPDENLTLFLRGELRHQWLIQADRRDPNTVRLQGVAGGTLHTDFGLTLHLAGVYCGGDSATMRDPVSIMVPEVPAQVPGRFYLMGSARYTFWLGESQLDLGLSLFNPFGGRFRELSGVRAADGSNYGGEFIGTRAILSGRIRY
jgi:outer membrane cobalamin receptor